MYALTDTLTHIIGRHALKFGFQVRHIQENSDYQLTSKPFFEFSSIFAFGADAPYLQAGLVNRNNCTGTPSPTCGQFTDTPRHFRWNQFAGFVQDDWKVNPRLTLNLGVRYDLFESPTETKGILSNVILGPGSNLFQQMAGASVGRVSKLWNTDKKNFAPPSECHGIRGEKATWSCARASASPTTSLTPISTPMRPDWIPRTPS